MEYLNKVFKKFLNKKIKINSLEELKVFLLRKYKRNEIRNMSLEELKAYFYFKKSSKKKFVDTITFIKRFILNNDLFFVLEEEIYDQKILLYIEVIMGMYKKEWKNYYFLDLFKTKYYNKLKILLLEYFSNYKYISNLGIYFIFNLLRKI